MRFRQKMMRACVAALLSISTIICFSLLYFVAADSVKQSQKSLQMATDILSTEVSHTNHHPENTLQHIAHTLMSTGLYTALSIHDAQGKEMVHETRAVNWLDQWLNQLPVIHPYAEKRTIVITPGKALLGTIDITANMPVVYDHLFDFFTILLVFWLFALLCGFLIFRHLVDSTQGAMEALVSQARTSTAQRLPTGIDEFRQLGQTIQRISQRLQRLITDKLHRVEREHQRALFENDTELFEQETFLNILDEYLMTPAISRDTNTFFIQIEGFDDPQPIIQGILPAVQDVISNYCARGFAGRLHTQPYTIAIINPNQENTPLLHMILAETLSEKIQQIGGHPYTHAVRIVSLTNKQLLNSTALREAGTQALSQIHPLSKGQLCENLSIDEPIDTRENLDLLPTIERVLHTGQLALVAQPTYRVDKVDGPALMGYELFSRIPVSQDQLLKASDFLPLLYQAHMGERLDLLVTELTIEALLLREQETNTAYAINLSPAVLTNISLQKRIIERIRHAKLKQRITCELSEFSVLKQEQAFRDFLERARAEDIDVALDQFGMQKRSLQLLSQVQLQYVKIAPSLILNFDNATKQQDLIRVIVEMAAVLDTPVIAIGVDTQERLHQLMKLGIAGAQGHLFGESKSLFYQRLSARH